MVIGQKSLVSRQKHLLDYTQTYDLCISMNGQTPNAKRQTPNAKRQTPNAKRQTPIPNT